MAVGVVLEDVGDAQRLDAVVHHAAPFAQHDADGHVRLDVLARGHEVAGVFLEVGAPVLEQAIVERVAVPLQEVGDLVGVAAHSWNPMMVW